MTKVGIADLKAHLSEHLREVRGGGTLTVFDRETPIAQIVPYRGESSLKMKPASRKPATLALPKRPGKPTDSLAVLLKDRASR